MGKNKLRKFTEIARFQNVFEAVDGYEGKVRQIEEALFDIKGKWTEEIFSQPGALVLELACGKGDYTLGLAQLNPEQNYIGIDIKGNRIWEGARIALDQEMDNVAFLRTRIEFITNYFEPGEVSECWITFPDPFLKSSQSNKRLTSTEFLDRYCQILQPGALLHLKTDDDTLYEFSKETIEAHSEFVLKEYMDDVYRSTYPKELEIQTYYEKMHLAHGKTIKYVVGQYRPTKSKS